MQQLITPSDVQIDQDRLKAENQNLVVSLRERTKKHQQTQELYDRLKRREMTAATQSAAQSAAYESVDDVLGVVPNRQPYSGRPQGPRSFQPGPVDHNGVERVHTHQRSGSSHSQGSGGMMPPPTRSGFHSSTFISSKPSFIEFIGATDTGTANVVPTPSSHRTQLGPPAQPTVQSGSGGYRTAPNSISRTSLQNTPLQRQPLNSTNANSASKNGFSGYGMSAGLKIGRQPSKYNPAVWAMT